MKKHTILFPQFFLIFLSLNFVVSAANADDLATIQSFLDSKTDDVQVLHGVNMACLNLTRTGTEDATLVLAQLLDDERFNTVARTALTNIPGDAGVKALRDSWKTLQGKNLVGVIQSLGAVRQTPTLVDIFEANTNNDEITKAVFNALAGIPTMEARSHLILKQPHIPGGPTVQRAEAILSYGEWLKRRGRADGITSAIVGYEELSQDGSGPRPDAAMLAIILADEEKGLSLLAALLQEETNISFNVPLRAVLELKSETTGAFVLASMGNLSEEKQAALVANLGARKETAIVPFLLILAQGDQPLLRLAAVQALGEIGDLRAVDTILRAVGASEIALSETAKASLKLFQGNEFDQKIITLLDSDDQKMRLAALELVGERQIAAACDKVRTLFTDTDVNEAAYKAFALAVTPTVSDIRFVLARVRKGGEQAGVREALTMLCRKIADRDAAAELFATEIKEIIKGGADTETGGFDLDCLFQLGGEKAAEALAAVAMETDDALTDKATQLLGRWTTPDAAPHLIHIARHHPNERYRTRTLSGYLRVIRQMGLPVEQKVQMAEKALSVATRDADKQRAQEVLDRFRAMAKGTPIFDGWEFRSNERWFRIEDGAIVGGTLEEPIPHNEFLTSAKEYGDFTLRIECKAIGKGCNGGVQFRSFRHPAGSNTPNEMIGYQADMTDTTTYWGAIYDESRRNRFVAEPKPELIESIFRPNDWNEYEIVCRGNNIKLYLNGSLTVDYTETDGTIPPYGVFALQIYGGPPSETWYRNIRIEE